MTLNMFTSIVTAAAVLVSAGSTPLCLEGDFDSQLRYVLNEVIVLGLKPDDLLTRVLRDVQSTLNKRWRGYKATPFGSFVSGLLSPYSDVDLYIQLPNYTSWSGSHMLQDTYKLFEKQPRLYKNLEYENIVNVYSSIKFIHIPTQRKVDLVFEFGELAVANTNLLKYFFNLDERSLPLANFLKHFFQIQKHNGHRTPRDYVLYLFIIFYLQQKNMAPSVYYMQKNSKSHIVRDWNMGFNELPYNTTNTEDLHQLVGGFFKYYSGFNYEEYVIAPYAGRPIKKKAFREIESLPEEYSFYNSHLKHALQLKIQREFDVSTTICVQDLLVLSSNEMERVASHKRAVAFKNFMKSVAKLFEELPSARVIRAILVMDRPEEQVRCYKHSSVRARCPRNCIDVE